MLNENIKRLRKLKGLSQEELAIKLNVVRQTVSKWKNGLSVPDSSMLIVLADELDISVSTLLGESVSESASDDLKIISEKLEVINLQLAKKSMNNNPELAVAGTILHGFEFIYVRFAPVVFCVSVVGIIFTYKKK